MVTIEKAVRIDETLVRLAFASDRATPVTFAIWHNGVRVATLLSTDGAGSIDLHVPAGEAHDVQILDQAGAVPRPAYPGRITLAWSGVAGAEQYRVEQFVSATWTLKATIADGGREGWTWLSDWLADGTTYQFRIRPVDAAGNVGTELPFIVEMVRTPDAPAVSYTWSAGTGKITVAAA